MNFTIINSVYNTISSLEGGGVLYSKKSNIYVINSTFIKIKTSTNGAVFLLNKNDTLHIESCYFDEIDIMNKD